MVFSLQKGYTIISSIKLKVVKTMKLDNNNHSVFLMYYNLVLVIKYRRKAFLRSSGENIFGQEATAC